VRVVAEALRLSTARRPFWLLLAFGLAVSCAEAGDLSQHLPAHRNPYPAPRKHSKLTLLLRPHKEATKPPEPRDRPQQHVPVRRGPTFISRYVFPDGELVPISTTVRAAESGGFEVRDVESLREHYALTLKHWVRRLEEHASEARRITDETIYRVWRLYISGSAHGFKTGRLSVYQTLLSKLASRCSSSLWFRLPPRSGFAFRRSTQMCTRGVNIA
jgi:hypothetical protein